MFENDDQDNGLSAEEQAEKDLLEAGREDDGGKTIPKDRFDEEVARLRKEVDDAKAEAERLQQSNQSSNRQDQVDKAMQQQRKQLASLQDKYEDLLMDGDKAGARAVRKELEQLRTQVTEAEIQTRENNIKASTRDETIFQRQVARIEAQYPALDPDNDAYDQDSVDAVSAMMAGFVQMKGVSRAEALKMATDKLMTRPEPAAPETKQQRGLGGRVAASRQQPPNSNRVGSDIKGEGLDIDVSKLSDKDFEKMDEAKIASLRGDFVE